MSSSHDTQQLIDDLKAARAELVKRGRCVGTLVNADHQVCARGAVAVVVSDTFEELFLNRSLEDEIPDWAKALVTTSAFRVERELQRHLPSKYACIELFNDARSTTDQDVLDLFDKALADLGGLA